MAPPDRPRRGPLPGRRDDAESASRARASSACATARATGAVEESANPNGSLHAIAGIYGGPRKNVFGLMPHPERMSEAILGGADGRKLFEAVLTQAA